MKKETKVIDINELKFDENNFNKHNEQGMELLEKSLRENGFGRSILLDKDNNIVGGNGVTEQAKKLGTTKVRVIETDGTEIIAVKRTDLELDSKKGREMALADNGVASKNLTWNNDALEVAKSQWGVTPENWGVDLPNMGLPAELEGKDLSPSKLADLDIYDTEEEMLRIIIVYKDDEQSELLKMLGLNSINKITYTFKELSKNA